MKSDMRYEDLEEIFLTKTLDSFKEIKVAKMSRG